MEFKNISFISQEDGLCTGCGVCSGVCPVKAILMKLDSKKGVLRPVIDEKKCILCGLCLKCCPGYEIDFKELTPSGWKNLPFKPLIGYYSKISIAHSNNDSICFNGSSGGLVTTLLIYLLKNKIIDGAIVTRMKKNEPLTPEVFIAKTEKQIISAQKSKYCPIPLGTIIKKIEKINGRYALVGLPCQIAGFRKAENNLTWLKDRIFIYLGLFCSRTPTFNATSFLLKNKKVKAKNIVSLDYRGNGHPGFMKIVLKDNKEIKIPHLNYNYWGHIFYNFFIPVRCYLCLDKVAYLADISFGDNWSSVRKHSLGSSSIIIRNPKYLSFFEEMEKENIISSHEIKDETFIMSQDLIKKCNIFPRIKLWKIMGGLIPIYKNTQITSDKPSFTEMILTLPSFIRVVLFKEDKSFIIQKVIAKLYWVFGKIWKKIIKILRIFKIIAKEFFKIMHALSLDSNNLSSFKKEKKHKIVIMGGYGSHDIGDEAMPHADIINFRKILGNDLEIVLLSPDPTYTTEFHKEKSIKDINELGNIPSKGIKSKIYNFRAYVYRLLFLLGVYLQKKGIHIKLWPSVKKVINEITTSDLIFNVGGGNLNSTIPQELYKKGCIYIAGHILNKPIFLSGQTIGPFTNKQDRKFAKHCLNKIKMITLRDKEVSRKRLNKIGVNKPDIIMDCADDAMTIPIIEKSISESILLKEVGEKWLNFNSDFIVAMNFKGSLKIFKKEGNISDLEKEYKLMAKIADMLAEEYNAKIVFIPTDFNEYVDDRECHFDILSKVKYKNSIKMIKGEYNDVVLKNLIGLFDIAIGSRYHFCVFAASMFIPFLGIGSGRYQQTKLEGLANLCNLPECSVKEDMEFATFDEVYSKILWVINNQKIIKNKLKKIVPILNKKSVLAVKEAVKILKKH